MKIKLLTILLIGLVCSSCATKTTPPTIIPPAPQKVESALPEIKKVKKEVKDGINTNNSVGTKLAEQENTIKEQTEGIDKALAIGKLLKDKVVLKQPVVEQDTNDLLVELGKVKSNNMFLELQNHDLMKLKNVQESNLQRMSDSLANAEGLVISKDNEANQLREQYKFLSEGLITKNKEVENLKESLAKEKKISATNAVYKHWVWGIVGTFALWTLIKNLLMMYFPAIKFRV